MKLLQQLWELDEREAQKKGRPRNYAFERIGLRLNRPLSTWEGYSCTPVNSSTLASTGGEGVHFGLVHLNGEVVDESPIVMTVPMECGEVSGNIIVGSNLYEFLCLGCETGYFYLEGLAYELHEDGFKFTRPDKWVDEETIEYNLADLEFQQCINALVNEFKIKPWTNIEARLNELQEQYLPLLQLKEDD